MEADFESLRQPPSNRGFVNVAVHPVHARTKCLDLTQHLDRREIPDVDDGLGAGD